VSKKRPRNDCARRARAGAESRADKRTLRYWQRRLFKNTFTYQGRRREVKRWCVKIQHAGTRRTFSLTAITRAAAALEAQTLYRMIMTQGWDTAGLANRNGVARAGRPRGNPSSWPKTDPRHWQQRLLLRKPPSPVPRSDASEFSARLEHAGTSAYFPLGTLDHTAAARRALAIYQTILREGWDAAQQQFSRELTIAIHWANNPLAWTYATFHTCPDSGIPRTPSIPLCPAPRWPGAHGWPQSAR
jgi:hypothetical protein